MDHLVEVRAEMSLADRTHDRRAHREAAAVSQLPGRLRDHRGVMLSDRSSDPERSRLAEDLAVLVGHQVPAAVRLIRDMEGLIVHVHGVQQRFRAPFHVRGDGAVAAALVSDDQLVVLDADRHLLRQVAEELRALHGRKIRLVFLIRIRDDLRALGVEPHVVVLDLLKVPFDLGDSVADRSDHFLACHSG